MSLLAAFGAMHLANDHTWRADDKNLTRKGKAMVRACRTALYDDEAEALCADALLKTTIRTMPHPFGLDSTWAAFKDGQVLRFIAEPLVIRSDVVPPTIVNVGLVISILDKMFALPIGDKFNKAYGSKKSELETLKKRIVPIAANYSSLHKHYGYNDQLSLSTDDEAIIESLRPVAAAYATVFEEDKDGQLYGTALSYYVQRAMVDCGGVVQMYGQAFETYKEKGTTVENLLGSGGTVATAASTTATP
jgi:hypothetical protein